LTFEDQKFTVGMLQRRVEWNGRKLDLASLTNAFNVSGVSIPFVSVERMGGMVKKDHLNSQR
jgi:hypothetical protein